MTIHMIGLSTVETHMDISGRIILLRWRTPTFFDLRRIRIKSSIADAEAKDTGTVFARNSLPRVFTVGVTGIQETWTDVGSDGISAIATRSGRPMVSVQPAIALGDSSATQNSPAPYIGYRDGRKRCSNKSFQSTP